LLAGGQLLSLRAPRRQMAARVLFVLVVIEISEWDGLLRTAPRKL